MTALGSYLYTGFVISYVWRIFDTHSRKSGLVVLRPLPYIKASLRFTEF